MASAFGHAVLALGLSSVSAKAVRNPRIIFWGVFSSFMPDFDVIAFRFGIPYHHMWGHRGITHSIFFALIWALLSVAIYKKWKPTLDTKAYRNILLYFFLCTVSHGILDALTTGGMGIAFFAPFSDLRYFLPWRLIRVSPLSIEAFFSYRAFSILKSEFIWIGIPSICLIILGLYQRRDKNKIQNISS